MRPYEQLIAWKEAHALCLIIYRISRSLPDYEKFALADQMRRAASSVPMNIAEGNAKRSRKEKARYFGIAMGSLEELHYQMRLSSDLGYIASHILVNVDQHVHRVSFLLTRLRTVFS